MTVRPTTDSPVGELVTLVLDRAEEPAGQCLPGRFVRERRTIRQTVDEILDEKVHLSPSLGGVQPRLLHVFDEPDRDPRAWSISIAHMVALPWAYVEQASGEWLPVSDSGGLLSSRHLLFDHDEILRRAVTSMRGRYEVEPDPDRLLEGPFTLLELRRLHEAVLGAPILKDTFNRRMRPLLTPSDVVPDSRPVGRPAQLFENPQTSPSDPSERWRLPRG